MRIKTEREKQREEDKQDVKLADVELTETEKDFAIALGNLSPEIQKMVYDEYRKRLQQKSRGYEESVDNQKSHVNIDEGSSYVFSGNSETSAEKEKRTSQDLGEKT